MQVRDAEAFNEEDSLALERIKALTQLEEFLYGAKQTLKDKEVRGRMEEDDLQTLQDEIAAADRWIDEVGDASRLEIEEKHQRLVDFSIGPILDKYRGGGGADPYDDDIYSEGAHDEL